MKLISCYIENFGKLHEYRYSFDDGLNVIREDNGWGKTTFAAFIKAMFYGMDYTTKKSVTDNERKHYMPWQGGQYGGYIVFEAKGKVYRIERFFGVKDKDDRYMVYDESTGMPCNDLGNRPGETLFGLDAFAFERSTFIPQDAKELAINDSLAAKLSNTTENGDVDSFEAAVASIDNRLKYFKKTGDRGRLAELEAQINDINRRLTEHGNKAESVEALKTKKAELEARRISIFNESKLVAEEIKRTSEYEGIKAKKEHYESLVKNQIEAKTKVDMHKMFFERPELVKELEKRKDDYDNYCELDLKHKDETDKLEKLELRKQGLNEQFAAQKKTPVASFILILLGILAAGCGVVLWAVMSLDMYIFVACAALGAVLVLSGIISWIAGGVRMKKQFKAVMDDIEEQIDCARSALRDVSLKKEQSKKSLENYIKCFQVSQTDNIYKALMEIEGKVRDYNNLVTNSENAVAKVNDFEQNNEMDKIRSLIPPKFSLEELQKNHESLNNEFTQVMNEKNDIVRRMNALANEDEDENDLIQNRENLMEELEASRSEYEILSITKEYLTTANERFKTKYIDNMKNAFRFYVEKLNGVMDNVSVDIDLNVTIEEFGERRGAEHYSTGYKDMLKLCTRFALVKAMFMAEQPFVILDDPFVNLDNDKLGNAMRLLEELAEHNQILYFTCHESRA